MKLFIDVKDVVQLSPAMNAAITAMQQNPNQQVGTQGLMKIQYQGLQFEVIRNSDSYTVRTPR